MDVLLAGRRPVRGFGAAAALAVLAFVREAAGNGSCFCALRRPGTALPPPRACPRRRIRGTLRTSHARISDEERPGPASKWAFWRGSSMETTRRWERIDFYSVRGL